MHTIKISKTTFNIPTRYMQERLAHMSEYDIAILNDAHNRAIIARFKDFIKAHEVLGSDMGSFASLITGYAQNYKFGNDSKKVQVVALRLAKAWVKEQVKSNAYKVSQLTSGAVEDYAHFELIDNDRFRNKARGVVPHMEQLVPVPYEVKEVKHDE